MLAIISFDFLENFPWNHFEHFHFDTKNLSSKFSIELSVSQLLVSWTRPPQDVDVLVPILARLEFNCETDRVFLIENLTMVSLQYWSEVFVNEINFRQQNFSSWCSKSISIFNSDWSIKSAFRIGTSPDISIHSYLNFWKFNVKCQKVNQNICKRKYFSKVVSLTSLPFDESTFKLET